VLIPVFNEEQNIPMLLGSLTKIRDQHQSALDVKTYLIDDGSRDETVKVARENARDLPIEVLEHASNQGPGAAFATGFATLRPQLRAQDWVLTMEGDNTSKFEIIEKMFRRSGEGFDAVFASPYQYGGGFTKTNLLRRFLSSAANLLVKDLLDIRGILTVSSFFRLYRGSAILRLQKIFGSAILEKKGFESMVEMVMKMAMLQLSISEVSMVLDSSQRRGKSKMKIGKTAFGYFSLWRFRPKWLEQANEARAEKVISTLKLV